MSLRKGSLLKRLNFAHLMGVKAAGAVFVLACTSVGIGHAQGARTRPNILMIVADDLGFADIGAFGSEIKTPQLDELAAMGQRFTSFYTSATCSPTRSMLLTGMDNHVVGLGNMAEWADARQQAQPGYEGFLNDRAASLASILREDGYRTYMAGKWHLGEEPDQRPSSHGFDQVFSVLDGAGSYWSDMLGMTPTHPILTYVKDNEVLTTLPEDYYSTTGFTDFIIDSIGSDESENQPFFAYLSYQVPHGPLALPDEWIDRYKGRYDQGYDILRNARLVRQKQLGVTGPEVVGFPRLPNIPAWNDLPNTQKRQMARKMEIYAAMVENMDFHIGRLIQYLEESGALSNTIIVFLSDNGAAGENIEETVASLSPEAKDWFSGIFDNRFENWGRPGSAVDYGPAWAQVSMVPFRQFKGVLAEGGIHMPMIVAGPGVSNKSSINASLVHVMDIAPTLIELAGVKPSSEHHRKTVESYQGLSIMPILTGQQISVRDDQDWLGWEIFGNRAIRQGDWKALTLLKKAGGTGAWQLFNLHDDPAELNDLSLEHPDVLRNMLELWKQYVSINGVVESKAGPFGDSG